MNDKSCLLDATVHILNVRSFANPDYPEGFNENACRITRELLLRKIGHDGSERGFHSQEIQDALRHEEVYMQRHELFPCLQLPPDPSVDPSRVRVVPIYSREGAPEIFTKKLNQHNGVLVHRKSNGVHHALSYQAHSNTAYDVSQAKFIPLEELDVVMFLEFIGS